MRFWVATLSVAVLSLSALMPRLVWAEGTEIVVYTGVDGSPFAFSPSDIELKKGQTYSIKLVNTSPIKHFFFSETFAGKATTKNLTVKPDAGAETSSTSLTSANIEVPPKSTVIWTVVPNEVGVYSDLHCTAPGHEETGMVGRIIVQ